MASGEWREKNGEESNAEAQSTLRCGEEEQTGEGMITQRLGSLGKVGSRGILGEGRAWRNTFFGGLCGGNRKR